MQNWSEKIGLICRPGWQIGMLGSLYYAGWCSTLLWLPRISDKYGRAPVFRFAMVVHTVLFGIIIVSRSYLLTLFSIFIVGVFTSLRTGVGWPYLLELVPNQSRPYHAMGYNSIGASWGIIGALYLSYVSKEVNTFIAIGFVL